MGKRQTFTQAELSRYLKAAPADDPPAIVEIDKAAGVLRIPAVDRPPAPPAASCG